MLRLPFPSFALTLVVACSAPLGDPTEAPQRDSTSPTEKSEQEISSSERLLVALGSNVDPLDPRFQSVAFDVAVSAAEMLTLRTQAIADLSPTWRGRLETLRKSYEESGDPERPNRYAEVVDIFAITRASNGRALGYSISIGTYQSWSHPGRCEDDCGSRELSQGERVYVNTRGRIVSRSEWEQ